MPLALIGYLVLQGVVFLLWGVIAFRWLFTLYAEAVAEAGSPWPGPRVMLRTFRGALLGPRHAAVRRRFVILTLLLLGLSAGFAWLSPRG